jgi:hypothetical protein
MSKGIVIKTNGKVESIMVDGLKGMQDIVGGYIECALGGDDWDLWANEEGRLIGLPMNMIAMKFVAKMADYDFDSVLSLHGDFLLMGHDGEGETTDCPKEIADIAISMAMFDEPQVFFFSHPSQAEGSKKVGESGG